MISAQKGKRDFTMHAHTDGTACSGSRQKMQKKQEGHVPILKDPDIFSVMRPGAGTGLWC